MLRTMIRRFSKMVLGASLLASGVVWGQANMKQDVLFGAGPAGSCEMGAVFDRELRPGPDGRTLQVKPASNAPYSAVGTTKMIRTLNDGNRIVRTNTMRYARDSQGRSRTEYSLAALGPFALEETRTVVTIEDPVAGRRYVLHPEQRRADVFDTSAMQQGWSRGELRGFAGGGGGMAMATTQGTMSSSAGSMVAAAVVAPDPAAVSGVVNSVNAMPAISSPFMVMSSAMPMPMPGCGPQGDAQGRKLQAAVPLGERTMEGVKAVGSRREFEIAAGTIGNEQAIVIRTEQWFSPEIGVVIESTHQDPMSGDTSYKLTQIRRGDPDASLFAVPPGYTTQEVPMPRFEKFDLRPAPEAGKERGD